jgi:hypothetical protein
MARKIRPWFSVPTEPPMPRQEWYAIPPEVRGDYMEVTRVAVQIGSAGIIPGAGNWTTSHWRSWGLTKGRIDALISHGLCARNSQDSAELLVIYFDSSREEVFKNRGEICLKAAEIRWNDHASCNASSNASCNADKRKEIREERSSPSERGIRGLEDSSAGSALPRTGSPADPETAGPEASEVGADPDPDQTRPPKAPPGASRRKKAANPKPYDPDAFVFTYQHSGKPKTHRVRESTVKAWEATYPNAREVLAKAREHLSGPKAPTTLTPGTIGGYLVGGWLRRGLFKPAGSPGTPDITRGSAAPSQEWGPAGPVTVKPSFR